MARRITGGGWVKQLAGFEVVPNSFTTKDTTVHEGVKLSGFFALLRGKALPAFDRTLLQQADFETILRICGAHLDSPAAVLLDDSPA